VTVRHLALCLVLGAGLGAGCATATLPTETTAPSAGATVLASPSISPTDTAAPGPVTIGHGERQLDPGTYRFDLDELAGGRTGGIGFSAFLVTLPDGWSSFGFGLGQPRSGAGVDPVVVAFWDVDLIYGHPCQWDGTLLQPGPTVDDLANALVAVPLRHATKPTDVTLDGYAGEYLEWSVPSDMDFSTCDLDGDEHEFKSWTAKGWADSRSQQAPGQVDQLWILDVAGARLVIDASPMPYATAEERAELLGIVESIRFER
jgi:hypothetical protein